MCRQNSPFEGFPLMKIRIKSFRRAGRVVRGHFKLAKSGVERAQLGFLVAKEKVKSGVKTTKRSLKVAQTLGKVGLNTSYFYEIKKLREGNPEDGTY